MSSELLEILKLYGPAAALLALVGVMLLRGEFKVVWSYPRGKKSQAPDDANRD